jgi:MFS family permease
VLNVLRSRTRPATLGDVEPSGDAPEEVGRSGRTRALLYPIRSLRHPAFLLLWLGQTSSTMGQWMDQFTRGWLIYQMTGSAAQLAFVSAARAMPLLFVGLFAGVLADRMNRKHLLMTSQALNVAINLALAVLIVSGTVEVWHVYATGVLSGIGMAVQQPARQSMIPSLVPERDLQNAVVLNAGTLNIGQAAGPAVAGLVVAALGMGAAYFTQAGFFIAAIVFTFSMVDPPEHRTETLRKESMLGSLRSGFSYVRTNDVVMILLLLALVPMFFGNPYQSLIPLFAADILDAGAGETGLLFAATGIGSVISLVVMAAMPPFKSRGRMLVLMAVLYGVCIAVFAGARLFLLSAVVLLLAGFMRSTYRAINHTMLLSETAAEYRGRINSMYLLDRGLVPLGTVVLGLLTAVVGAPTAVLTMGVLCALGSAAAVVVAPRIWRV